MNLSTLVAIAILCLSSNAAVAASRPYCDLPPYPEMGWVTYALEHATHKGCAAISPDDLLKITELEVNDNVHPGNLRGLTNLKALRIKPYGDHSFYFTAGAFEGAENLESIEFSSQNADQFGVGADSFKNLKNLRQIKVRIGTDVSGDSAGFISKDAFVGTSAIDSVEFDSHCGIPTDPFNFYWYAQPGAFNGIDSKKVHINFSCVKPSN